MTRPTSRFFKWCPILLVLFSAPFVVAGALAIKSDTADVMQWLPDGRTERRQYQWFTDHFGGDDFLLITWPGCTLEDERLGCLASALSNDAGDDAPEGRPRLFQRVITGPDVLADLTSPPLNLSRTEALDRMEGIWVGSDRSTTCALVQMTPEGTANQHAAIEAIYTVSWEECRLDRQTLRLGGSVYEAVVIDDESHRSLQYIAPSCLVALLVAGWCLRSVQLTVIVFTAAVYCQCLSVALVYYTHGHLNAVLLVMPTLVYVLTISGAIHLVNYYRDALRDHGPLGAAGRAFRVGWLPCVLASGSTAIGIGSLAVSEIEPIRTFGVYSAISLLISLVVLLAFLPAALELWPFGRTRNGQRSEPPNQRAAVPELVHGLWVFSWVIRFERWVTVLCLVVVAFFGFGLTRITTSVKFERMFPSHSEIIQNYRWIEEHIGPLIPIEIIVGFDQRCSLDMAERLELVSTIEDSLRPIPETGGIISAATYAPTIPKASGLRAAIRRRIFVKRLEDGRHRFVDEGFLATDGDEELWRVTARIPAVHDVDYGEFVSRVRQQVEPIVKSQQDRDIEGITVTYTGMSPLFHEAQQQLLDDLIKSFLIAFLLICPIMMIILRGFWAGLLSMIPNVVPAVIVFGGLGWLGIAVDIGTMLCASVGLGIAVDDTLHFLTWYARGIREGLTSHQAVRNAYHYCASAMFQTTLICGCGILVFSFSHFLPTSRFAWLMFILLWAALLGDLILLPALLAGPLGKVFARSQRQRTRSPEPAPRDSDG